MNHRSLNQVRLPTSKGLGPIVKIETFVPTPQLARDAIGLARRVARWSILRPKIPIWVNFGGP
jgi:hypothetical protein